MVRWTRPRGRLVGLSRRFSVGFAAVCQSRNKPVRRAGGGKYAIDSRVHFRRRTSRCEPWHFCRRAAQDAYNVGVTAAMTGPAAATQAPVIEMLRIYVDRLNAKGGINGHRINLLIEDDQAEPSKAAANATKLIRQDNVILLINSSLSSTYGPVIAEAQARQRAAVVRRRGVSEGDAPAEARSGAVLLDRIRFQRRHSGRDQLDQGHGEGAGEDRPDRHPDSDLAHRHRYRRRSVPRRSACRTVDKEFIPPATADYTPFATKIKRRPTRTGAMPMRHGRPKCKTFEALRRLGWSGNYLAYGHIQAEDELKRIADGGFQVFTTNALFQDNLPVQKEIRQVAARRQIFLPGNLWRLKAGSPAAYSSRF